MRRFTPFERDFADLHGPDALREVRIEVVRDSPASRYSPNRYAFGFGLLLLSIFYIVVLGAILAVFGFLTWAVISSF